MVDPMDLKILTQLNIGRSLKRFMKNKIEKSYDVFIPARGGSKGIPNKNLQKINGQSLLARAVLTARMIPAINNVYVSTDSNEIALEAIKCGAMTLNRPDRISGDKSPTEDAIIHFLTHFDTVDKVIFMQATSPFTVAEDLQKGIELFETETIDSVISVCTDHGGFLCGGFRWYEGDSGSGIAVDYEISEIRPRRQDMTTYYRENGAFYIFKRKEFLIYSNRLYGKVGLTKMPRWRSFEIDEPEDLEIARKLIEKGIINP
jgi:CMP-N-acetylneuraminic acid synthetase